MRDPFYSILKSHSCRAVLQAREHLGLTQAQVADRLSMDTRPYLYLEYGKSCCGALTLVLFLLYCCPDPVKFLKELRNALEAAAKNAA